MRKTLTLLLIGISLLFALVATGIIAAYREHRHNSQQLLQGVHTLSQEYPHFRLMDAALVTLHEAENNFRLYTSSFEPRYLTEFGNELAQVSSLLDTISTPEPGQPRSQQFEELVRKKAEMSGKLGQLKKATDSLLTRSLKDEMIDKLLNSIPVYNVAKVKKEEITMDTVNNVQQPKEEKKGFFKRIGNALANKKDTVKAQMTIMVRTKDGKIMDKQTYDAQRLRNILRDVNVYYKDILRKQLSGRSAINTTEQMLAGNNMVLLQQVKALILKLREQAANEQALVKSNATREVNASNNKMSTLAMAGVAGLLFCMVLGAVICSILYLDRRKLKAAKKAALEVAQTSSDFLNNMSHEIRTPLNSIVGFSEQLSYTPLNADQQELLRAVSISADMLMEVVNDVLDFSKLEGDYISIQKQAFPLYPAFEEVINTMSVQATKKKLILNFDFQGKQQTQVVGDTFRLKQILFNLVSNAIKYTDEGEVSVKAVLEEEQEGKALLTFTVTDSGPGISEEALPHIFDRFYQVKSPRITEIKGTGLGLAITKRLLLMHGGDIEVDSAPGKGSRFTGHIPYETVQVTVVEVSKAKEKVEKTGARMADKYVLVADDQEMNLLLLKMILTRWQCRFDMAVDGSIAWELFQQNNYDLVLLDLQMPKMSGIDVVQKIRQDKDSRKAKVPVLALTADISQQDMIDFRKAGFNDWLLKPTREKDIYATMVKYVDTAKVEANPNNNGITIP